MNQYLEIVRRKAKELSSQAVPAQSSQAPRALGNGNQVASPATEVRIGTEDFHYSIWSGEQLAGEMIAFDTETARIESDEIPDLALASASDGTTHCLIHPHRLAEFITTHQQRHLVGHNVAFDFWVVQRHLCQTGQTQALAAWWTIPDEARLHDTMWLDALIRLAKNDGFPHPRDLGQIAHQYAGLKIDKKDPYRLRYDEIIGQDWASVEQGFFDYAIKDSITTHRAFVRMVAQAKTIMAPYRAKLL